jgi:ABC-2 type transport system ATP-binding protein
LLNSHLLSEVEITCDRVAFIKDGEILETRELGSLLEEQTTVTIRAANISSETHTALKQSASSVRVEGDLLILSVTSTDVLPDIVRCLVEKGAEVYEVTPHRLSLEERFLQIVGSDGGL